MSGACAETPAPLTGQEVAELDTYGDIRGYMPLPARALELWEREILWGRVTPDPRSFGGLLKVERRR